MMSEEEELQPNVTNSNDQSAKVFNELRLLAEEVNDEANDNHRKQQSLLEDTKITPKEKAQANRERQKLARTQNDSNSNSSQSLLGAEECKLMETKKCPKTSKERVQAYRERLRLARIQIDENYRLLQEDLVQRKKWLNSEEAGYRPKSSKERSKAYRDRKRLARIQNESIQAKQASLIDPQPSSSSVEPYKLNDTQFIEMTESTDSNQSIPSQSLISNVSSICEVLINDNSNSSQISNNSRGTTKAITFQDYQNLFQVFARLPRHNVWSQVKMEDFAVKVFIRVMGVVNHILCCELTEDARDRLLRGSPKHNEDQCTGIVVKFVKIDQFFNISPLEMAINNQLVSQRNISPRLLFASEQCYINEYIEGHNYSYEDDCDAQTCEEFAKVLARLHSLCPPISNDGYRRWQNQFHNYRTEGSSFKVLFDKQYLAAIDKFPELKQKYYSFLSEIDICSMLDYVNDLIENSGSPIVFVHGNLNRGNIIVQESKSIGQNGESAPIKNKNPKKIFLVDFDYSTYNYRGYDLGRYFSNYKHCDSMWGYHDDNYDFPNDQEMVDTFLEPYRQQCAAESGEKKKSFLEKEIISTKQLIKECKIFALNAYMIDTFHGLFMCSNWEQSLESYEFALNIAINRYRGYKTLKQRFINDGTIKEL